MSSLDHADLHRQIDGLAPELIDVVERSPDVMGGLPVFRGTRVPARALLDYLAAGDSLDTFLDDFPSVHREQAIGETCACCSTSASHVDWHGPSAPNTQSPP